MPTPAANLESSSSNRWWRWAAPAAIALAGVIVYAGSLNAPLVFDDVTNIVENDAVQNPAPHKLLHVSGRRQVAFISFALNQLAHGTWPAGYRATNVAIHMLAAIVLFDLVRVTLSRTNFGARHSAAIAPIAFAAALLWVVHPLATQAVTSVVQRMESLAALFYLTCLWGLARGATSSRAWLLLSVFCCWLGMATKETAATLPIAALMFDRIYLAASWRELWRKRWAFYVALVPMTLWLVVQSLPELSGSASSETTTVGVGIAEATPWEYLRTQAGVVLHYLRLALWPVGQCFDYDWPVAQQMHQWLPAVAIMTTMLLATAVLLWQRPQIGFLPAMFFLVLAPTSSVLPIRDIAVEHRMYLPLATVIVGMVLLCFALCQRVSRATATAPLGLMIPTVLLAIATVLLGATTVARNRVYLSELALWSDVVAKAPHNARGHYNLGLTQQNAGQTVAAAESFRRAMDLSTDDRDLIRARIVSQYGVALAQSGNVTEGLPLCEEGALLDPNLSEIQVNLGVARALAGDDRGALRALAKAIEIRPDRAEAHFNLGQIAQRMGHLKLAEYHFSLAQRLEPTLPDITQRIAQVRHQLRSAPPPAHPAS